MINTRIAKYLAPALLLGLLFFSCTQGTTERTRDERVIATINDVPLTVAEFKERYARAGFTQDSGADLEVKRDFLNHLIERKMMLAEAGRRQIEIGRAELDRRVKELRSGEKEDRDASFSRRGIDFETWKSDVREDLMIEQLLASEVDRHAEVSKSEVNSYYRDNLREFEKPAQVHVRQIVVATEEDARKTLELIKEHKDFATLARERSNAPEAERGGDLGWFGKGDMPAEFDVVFTLPVGGTSGIVKSPYGFHIFKLEEKKRAGRIPLKEAYQEIEEQLRQEKENNRYREWTRDLRARTKLEVNYEILEQ